LFYDLIKRIAALLAFYFNLAPALLSAGSSNPSIPVSSNTAP
jgi:hypothetical protein